MRVLTTFFLVLISCLVHAKDNRVDALYHQMQTALPYSFLFSDKYNLYALTIESLANEKELSNKQKTCFKNSITEDTYKNFLRKRAEHHVLKYPNRSDSDIKQLSNGLAETFFKLMSAKKELDDTYSLIENDKNAKLKRQHILNQLGLSLEDEKNFLGKMQTIFNKPLANLLGYERHSFINSYRGFFKSVSLHCGLTEEIGDKVVDEYAGFINRLQANKDIEKYAQIVVVNQKKYSASQKQFLSACIQQKATNESFYKFIYEKVEKHIQSSSKDDIGKELKLLSSSNNLNEFRENLRQLIQRDVAKLEEKYNIFAELAQDNYSELKNLLSISNNYKNADFQFVEKHLVECSFSIQ